MAAFVACVVGGCGAGLVAPGLARQGGLAKDSPKSPATFPIKLHRPAPVGYRERLTSVVTKQETKVLRVDGQLVKRETVGRTLRFAAVAKVLAVNARGQATRAEYRIEQFVAEEGGRQETVIEQGRVLTVVRGDPPGLTLDQGVLSDQARQDVDTVLPVDPPDEYTDDDIFGSKVPRPVGARWPIDRAKASKSLGRGEMPLAARDITGETRLLGTKSERGIPSLELGAQVEAKVRALPGLPAGAKVTRGVLEFEFHAVMPVDTSAQPLRDTSQMEGQFVVAFEAGGKRAVLESNLQMHQESEHTPAP